MNPDIAVQRARECNGQLLDHRIGNKLGGGDRHGNVYVVSGCLATATLTDSTGKGGTLNLVIGEHGQNVDMLEADSTFVRTGAAHSGFRIPADPSETLPVTQ